MLDATEDAADVVTSKSVTFVHSGHLGEPLSETDEGGRVLRHSVLTPFGERLELAPAATAVNYETANPYTIHSTTVAVPGARAVKLHFTDLALATCDSVVVTDGYSGPVVAEVPSTASGDVWTDWLPTDRASVELRAKGCGMARGFKLTEVLPQWGGATSEARMDTTTRPYPAAGQQFRVSLGQGGYVKLTNLNLASCDVLEARSTTGQPLWRWKPLASYYQVWTAWLTGDVDIGIWGQGCNASEQKYGFTLAEVRRDAPVRAPLVLGLPGQRTRADLSVDNWNRWFDPTSGRYLSPEPLLQSPGYMTTMAARGMQVPTYAYAANNPLRYVDQNGLYFTSSSSAVWGALQRLAANPRTRWVVEMMAADPNVEFAINEVPYEQCAESGGITWLPFQRDARGTQSIQIDVNLTKANFARSGFSDDPVPWTLDSLVGHELGHGFGFAYGALNFDAMAVEVENYLRLPGPLRESHDRGVCKRPMPEICGR